MVVLQARCQDVTQTLQGCYRDVTGTLQGHIKCVTQTLKGRLYKDSIAIYSLSLIKLDQVLLTCVKNKKIHVGNFEERQQQINEKQCYNVAVGEQWGIGAGALSFRAALNCASMNTNLSFDLSWEIFWGSLISRYWLCV